jgi:hypothetical protein
MLAKKPNVHPSRSLRSFTVTQHQSAALTLEPLNERVKCRLALADPPRCGVLLADGPGLDNSIKTIEARLRLVPC